MKRNEHHLKSLWKLNKHNTLAEMSGVLVWKIPAAQKVFETLSKFILELISQQDFVKTKKICQPDKHWPVERFCWVPLRIAGLSQ